MKTDQNLVKFLMILLFIFTLITVYMFTLNLEIKSAKSDTASLTEPVYDIAKSLKFIESEIRLGKFYKKCEK